MSIGSSNGATRWYFCNQRNSSEAKGMTFEALQQKVKEVDPLTYAQNVNPRGVLMVNARRDTIVPPDCTLELWEAMGKPQILWYDTDHVQMLAYLFEIMNLVVAHFAAENW